MAPNGLMRNIILVILVLFIFLPINAVAPYGHIIVDEHGKKRSVTAGEKWKMDHGFILTVDTMEKSAKITLSKDGKILAAEEILIDDNMYYEGNIDGIDYVFQTTLRAVERNSAVLADTELYAPNVVELADTEPYAPNVDEQPNYVTIIVSILVIVTLIFIIYKTRNTPLKGYISRMEEWEKEGYDVKKLKEALGRKKIKEEDMDFLKTKFDEFERKIAKLKSLEKELDSLDTEGFESEVRMIKSKLKSPDKIPEIENEIEELKVKIENRVPTISLKRTTSEISVKEGQEFEVTIEVKNEGEDSARSVSLSDRINNDLKIISGENSWTGDLQHNESKLLRYTVKADKAGKYIFPQLVVEYQDKHGKRYEKSADAVEIEVTPGKKNPEKAGIKPKPIATPAPKNTYGVVIGINKYEDNDIPALKYAKNDAIEIYNILTDPNYGNFSDKNVKLLLDEQATLLEIKSAMGTFLPHNAQKDDVVYIFFAGHGSPELDPTGKADDNFEKYIVPYDAKKYDLFSSGLSMEDIKTIFQRIKSNRVIFFIDSCYSGEAGGRTFSRPGFQTKDLAMSDRFLEELSAEGRIIFAASKPDELSLEIDELQHGLFTYYLAEGLKGKADLDDDGVVTIDELINYVSENVPRKAQQLGGRQHPLRKGESAGKIPLTFCETEIKRQIRELNSDAAESFEKRDYETAIKKWNEVIRRENDNSKALNGIKEANKKIGEKIAILEKKQSILIRLHGKGLPTKEFDEAMTLLKKDTSIYTEKEKKICKYVEEMLGDNLCIETYLDTRKLIENNTD